MLVAVNDTYVVASGAIRNPVRPTAYLRESARYQFERSESASVVEESSRPTEEVTSVATGVFDSSFSR